MSENVKDVALRTQNLFEALEALKPEELAAVNDVSKRVVGLRDTPGFNIPVDFISRAEVSDLRRQLAEAISFEKWVDGFIFAMQLMSMVAGGL